MRDIGIRRAQVGQLFFVGLSIASTIGTALIYWVGGHMVLAGHDQRSARWWPLSPILPASTVRFLRSPMCRWTLPPPWSASSGSSSIWTCRWRFEDKPDAVALDNVDGHIQFEDVSFAYQAPDEWSSRTKGRMRTKREWDKADGAESNAATCGQHSPAHPCAAGQFHLTSSPASWWPWSAPAGPARRPSPICCRASTIPPTVGSRWTATICAT